ncbi:ABC-2 transporter permease, partial [Bacteroidota bacterium]
MLKLVLKDFIANKDIILFRTILPGIIISFFFIFPYVGWHGYWIYCCLTVIIGGSFYHIRSKNTKIELLICSLPVSRSRVVYSKYLLALLLTIIVLPLGCLNAYLADMLWEMPATRLSELFNLKVLFMALFLIIVHFSLFLPSVFVFRTMGVIISFIISLVF